MFDRLKLANSDSSSLNKQHTLSRFMSYTLDKDQSPVQGIAEIEELARSLDEIGLKQAEETIVTKIVSCFPRRCTISDSVGQRGLRTADFGESPGQTPKRRVPHEGAWP